ncbi:MAG TPA: hypothetical protein VJB12_05225 [Candidatus Nanoarchaeia archaeon]|nr:hypothetical protein [Candidatus Nanoarchaeia archaeon]
MADIPPLDTLDMSGINDFFADFTALIKVAKGIDRYYQLGKPNLDVFVPKYKKTLTLFNKKYTDLSLLLKRSSSSLHLQVALLGEESLQALFANSASRIKGLSAIGLKRFDETPIAEQDKVEKALTRMSKRIYVSYADPESGSSRFMIERHGKGFLLICNHKDLLIRNSPEFRLCAYYALRHPYAKNMDVLSHASSFGFTEYIGLNPHDLNDEFEPSSRSY